MSSKNSLLFPSVSANSMDIGDISIGEDGQQYIVAISVSGKNGKTKNVWKVYEPEEVIPEIVEEPEPPVQEVVKPVAVKKKVTKKQSDKEDKKSENEKVSEIPSVNIVKETEKEESKKEAKKKTKKSEKVEKTEKVEVPVVEKVKRLPNEYNRFVSTKMAEYRESHPDITNGREKMKMAAAEWKAIKVAAA